MRKKVPYPHEREHPITEAREKVEERIAEKTIKQLEKKEPGFLKKFFGK